MKKLFLKNTAWLTISEAVKNSSLFVLSVLIARLLGVDEYGQFAFAIAFGRVVAVLADFGLGTLLIREIASREIAGQRLRAKLQLETAIVLKLMLGFIAVLLLLLAVQVLIPQVSLRLIILMAGLWIILEAGISFFQALFRAFEKMQYEALFQGIYSLLLLSVVGFVLFAYRNVQTVILGYLISALIVLILIVLFVRKNFLPFELKADWRYLRGLIKSGSIIFLSTIAFVLYFRADVLLIGWLKDKTAVGLYSAIYNLVFGFRVLPMILTNVFYPRFSKKSGVELQQVLKLGNLIVFSGMIFLFSALYLLRENLISLLYGEAFVAAIPIVLPLGAALVFSSLAHLNYFYLYALHKEKIILVITWLGVFINLVLNLALIPVYSYVGAAYATLMTEGVLLTALLGLNFGRLHPLFVDRASHVITK